MRIEIGDLAENDLLFAVPLAMVKVHLGIEATDESEDIYLKGLIWAAFVDSENYTHRKLLKRSLTAYTKGYNTYQLPYFPFAEIKVWYWNDTTYVEFLPENVLIDTTKVCAELSFRGSLPTLDDTKDENIKITWQGGFDKAKFPNVAWQAILLKVRDVYDNRNDPARRYANASENLLNGLRVYSV